VLFPWPSGEPRSNGSPLLRAPDEEPPSPEPASEPGPAATTTASTPSPPPAAPPGPGGGGIDEIYDQVLERLRRDLLADRERMGDLLGDLP
jgi:hypothetical protein